MTKPDTHTDFLKIVDGNKGIIYKVANAYCHNHEERKDLAQEIIIQLWKSFDRYNSQYKLSTWMYRIALNVAISSYRKASVREKHNVPFEPDFVQISEEQNIEQDENIKMLRKFIQELDELNRALMILYLEDKSHKEIAEILGITPSNVATKISRIKSQLKQKFTTIKH